VGQLLNRRVSGFRFTPVPVRFSFLKKRATIVQNCFAP
jgi:hypothetical protein